MAEQAKYLNVQQAAEALGTNRRRIWQLIKEGKLEIVPNPLDRREKLVARSKVEELAQFSKKAVA
jgi:predicted DNA-binding transcriptional regulator AlpA